MTQPPKRVLFARIGYMTYYAGPQPGDERPIGGGSYNKAHIGHEVFNFKQVGGHLWGYFQPYSKDDARVIPTVNLERIDPSAREQNSLKDVTVIFVATSKHHGQVIVGWYTKAIVHRDPQDSKPTMSRGNFGYYIQATAKHCVLLPTGKRNHTIPCQSPGAMGTANAFYLHDQSGEARNLSQRRHLWISKAISLVQEYTGPNLLTDPSSEGESTLTELQENLGVALSGQGFLVDADLRRKIERYAVAKASQHFRKMGYQVEDVGDRRSYDLECRKGKDLLIVEVKGTQTTGDRIILTPNEVEVAKKNRVALFVLHSVKVKAKGKNKTVSGGKPLVFPQWKIAQHGHLKPISFIYELGQ